MNAAQALANWVRAVVSIETAQEAAERKLADHLAHPCTSTESADHRRWLTIKRDLEEGVEAEKRALINAQERRAEAQEAAKEAAIDDEAKVAARASLEAAKLTPEVGTDAERLAGKLKRLDELKAIVDAYNEKRGRRPFIVDGEAKVREVPEQVIPAVYEETVVWRDAAGKRPYQFRHLPNGDVVPKDGGYSPVKEKHVSRAEQVIPAHVPGGRFADSMKLMGLKGEQLFPAR